MEFIYGIILGVVVMSICAIFATMAVEDGKDTLAIILCGPAMWIFLGVSVPIYKIIHAIKLGYFRKNYDMYYFYHNDTYINTYYIHQKVADYFVRKDGVHKHYIVWKKDCHSAKSLPSPCQKITPHNLVTKVIGERKGEFIKRYLKDDCTIIDKI